METDKRYFVEGLFVIGFSIAAALFAAWLVNTGHRDDLVYRVHFAESVSGLAVGDPVKFHGVDVGTVKTIELDSANPRLVQVDVSLRKDTPVKLDSKASLKLKGITGVVYIELDGGSPDSPSLLAATPEGQVPEIAYERSSVAAITEQLPMMLQKFTALEDQTRKVVADVGSVTRRIKEDPSLLLRSPPEKGAPPDDRSKSKAASPRAAPGNSR
jgi:phospholipid/cholesterol/gamma-HCH transport system substrate-binding protein